MARNLAIVGLGIRDPGDRTIIGVRRYEVDLAKECGPIVCALSIPHWIYVFVRPDGVARAVRIACPPGAAS